MIIREKTCYYFLEKVIIFDFLNFYINFEYLFKYIS